MYSLIIIPLSLQSVFGRFQKESLSDTFDFGLSVVRDRAVRSRSGSIAVVGLANVARAGNRELEAVNMETLLVSVGQETDEVVLLETLGVEVFVVDVRAGSLGVHALFDSLGLGVLLVAFAVALGVVLIGQVDDDLKI